MAQGNYVVFRVNSATECILRDLALEINPDVNFLQAFEGLRASSKYSLPQFKQSMLDGSLERIYVSQIKNPNTTDQTEVLGTLNVQNCCKQFGYYVQFILKSESLTATEIPEKDGVRILMENASALEYPPLYTDPIRSDLLLFNDIVHMMKTKGFGFRQGNAAGTGKNIVNVLAHTLFYFNPKPRQALLQKNSSSLDSELFRPFFEKSYNDPAAHHHKMKEMTCKEIELLCSDLANILCLPEMSVPRMKLLREASSTLLACISGYKRHLEKANVHMNDLHRSLNPARSPTDDSSSELKTLTATTRSHEEQNRYLTLEQTLQDKDYYSEPVFVNDLAPPKPQEAHIYYENIKLPFAVQLFKYNHGNYLGTLYFVWRVNSDPAEQNFTAMKRCMDYVEGHIPVYHSREMRRQFHSRFSTVAQMSSSVYREMYQFLTGDATAPNDSISKEVQTRLRHALDMQDPSLMYDLRHLNEGRPAIYDEFWEAVKVLINDSSLAAADDRRHSNECHMAVAMSVTDLIQRVKEANPQIETPSASWTALQFYPKNSHFHAALHYSGKLEIRHMVQSRQLRHEHPDSHYCNTMYKYLRDFVTTFKANTLMISMDDKHSVQIGEPNFPVAAVERGRRVLVSEGQTFAVGDHDFTKVKVIPSVTLVVDIPDSSDESFYMGQVNVCLKEGALQPSSPLRHMTELLDILRNKTDRNLESTSILALYTDGGPDHRLTFLAVKISLITIFKALDLDYLIAVRTCPNQSFRNPVERIMSIINIALQSVGLMRTQMPDSYERRMKSVNSLKDLRTLAQKDPAFQDVFHSSLADVCTLLKQLIGRLKLKGKPFSTTTPATDGDMNEVC